MYTNSIAKYHDSLHISMIVSLSPFINKKRFDNSVVSFRIFTSMLAGDTRHHWLGRPPGFGRCQMQSHSTTGQRLSVSQFDLASRYKKKTSYMYVFWKNIGGGGVNYFNQCIICLVPLSLNDITKGSNNEQITRGNTIPSGIVYHD